MARSGSEEVSVDSGVLTVVVVDRVLAPATRTRTRFARRSPDEAPIV